MTGGDSFSTAILSWYAAHGRDLPWRHTKDPYAIWLSEVILQQTRIAQGISYWERFIRRFPDVASLAEAPQDEVLRLWEGLGYYSRARNLHAAAREIAALGRFPDTYDGIRRLRGVGDYTAAAIASIAFGADVAVLDGNVYRVLARYFGREEPVGTTAAKKRFSALAQSLLPPGKAADFNQGMMDFGALVCTPARPACDACPLAPGCHARATGRTESLPVKKAAAPVRERFLRYYYLRCGGWTALHRRPAGDIWQGLWEPFCLEGAGGDPPEWLRTARPLRRDVIHQLTHRTLHADLYYLELPERPALPEGYGWIRDDRLSGYAMPRLVRILLEAIPPEP